MQQHQPVLKLMCESIFFFTSQEMRREERPQTQRAEAIALEAFLKNNTMSWRLVFKVLLFCGILMLLDP